MVTINPGAGPVSEATIDQAITNMTQFLIHLVR